jgi:glycolate oxidase FAD binding subunit
MSRVASRFDELAGAVGAPIVSARHGRLFVSPRTTDEVAAVLRFCDANGIGVEISGAGTKRSWAGAVRSDLVLDTRGLAAVREHSWQDLTATVGAGTTWA